MTTASSTSQLVRFWSETTSFKFLCFEFRVTFDLWIKLIVCIVLSRVDNRHREKYKSTKKLVKSDTFDARAYVFSGCDFCDRRISMDFTILQPSDQRIGILVAEMQNRQRLQSDTTAMRRHERHGLLFID